MRRIADRGGEVVERRRLLGRGEQPEHLAERRVLAAHLVGQAAQAGAVAGAPPRRRWGRIRHSRASAAAPGSSDGNRCRSSSPAEDAAVPGPVAPFEAAQASSSETGTVVHGRRSIAARVRLQGLPWSIPFDPRQEAAIGRAVRVDGGDSGGSNSARILPSASPGIASSAPFSIPSASKPRRPSVRSRDRRRFVGIGGRRSRPCGHRWRKRCGTARRHRARHG